jgi:hypothetical protein
MVGGVTTRAPFAQGDKPACSQDVLWIISADLSSLTCYTDRGIVTFTDSFTFHDFVSPDSHTDHVAVLASRGGVVGTYVFSPFLSEFTLVGKGYWHVVTVPHGWYSCGTDNAVWWHSLGDSTDTLVYENPAIIALSPSAGSARITHADGTALRATGGKTIVSDSSPPPHTGKGVVINADIPRCPPIVMDIQRGPSTVALPPRVSLLFTVFE